MPLRAATYASLASCVALSSQANEYGGVASLTLSSTCDQYDCDARAWFCTSCVEKPAVSIDVNMMRKSGCLIRPRLER